MKVFVDGKEVPGDSVEIHIIQAAPVEPSEPEAPTEPAEPVDPIEPEEPAEPEAPPVVSGTLLVDEAATMQPGEWRSLVDKTTWPGKDEGVSFKGFQYLKGVADGMGWTQRIMYYEGQLMMLLCRDYADQALMLMDAAGNFRRHDNPPGFGADGIKNGGRRPFNRLTQDGEYLIFAPRGAKDKMGHIIRTPLNNPGVFEKVGPDIGGDHMDTTGNFSFLWVGEWGRFYAYTPGARIWSRAPDDTAWTEHARLPKDSEGHRLTGYGGMLVWNHIKQEILIQGGQTFGDTYESSDMVYRLTSPLGDPELLANRKYPDGSKMIWSSGSSRCLVHPVDGSYLIFPRFTGADRIFYRSVTGGGTMELFEDFSGLFYWGRYEPYAPITLIPGTEVFAYVSHIEGLGLWRPKSTVGFRVEPEDDDVLSATETQAGGDTVVEPDPGAPDVDPDGELDPDDPEIGVDIAVLASQTDFGQITMLGGSHTGFDTFKQFWKNGGHDADQDTFGPVAHWDRHRRKLVYVRDRSPGEPTYPNNVQVKLYDAATQAWTHGDMSSAAGQPMGGPHPYYKHAYDRVRGYSYFGAYEDRICRYRVDQDAWEFLPVSSTFGRWKASPTQYHEELDMLIAPQSQHSDPHLLGWKTDSDSWISLGSMNGHDAYQCAMRYNPIRKDMLMVGGNASDFNERRVTLIDGAGNIVEKNPIPLGEDGMPIFGTLIGGNYGTLFYDPLTGNYLYRSSKKIWEYSPDLDEWRVAADLALPEWSHLWPGNYFGWVMAPIDELGVIAWLSFYGARLYRHKSVF